MAEAIRFSPIPPHSSYLNGKVERVQRTLLEKSRLMVDAKALGVADHLAGWVHEYNWNRLLEASAGLASIGRVCERANKSPLHGEVSDAYQPAKARIQIREHAVEIALQWLKPCT